LYGIITSRAKWHNAILLDIVHVFFKVLIAQVLLIGSFITELWLIFIFVSFNLEHGNLNLQQHLLFRNQISKMISCRTRFCLPTLRWSACTCGQRVVGFNLSVFLVKSSTCVRCVVLSRSPLIKNNLTHRFIHKFS